MRHRGQMEEEGLRALHPIAVARYLRERAARRGSGTARAIGDRYTSVTVHIGCICWRTSVNSISIFARLPFVCSRPTSAPLCSAVHLCLFPRCAASLCLTTTAAAAHFAL